MFRHLSSDPLSVIALFILFGGFLTGVGGTLGVLLVRGCIELAHNLKYRFTAPKDECVPEPLPDNYPENYDEYSVTFHKEAY